MQWTDTINVAVCGTGLQKVNGCEGCDDASAVSRQMIRLSRIGTPDATSVPKVRMVRATITFSMIPPKTGSRSFIQSTAYLPRLNFLISLTITTNAIGARGIDHQ